MGGTPVMLSGIFANRYAIERELGRGATATVYLARDTRTGRSVAIKVLRAELTETVGADRFLREIAVSERLRHPHIATVLDSGRHENQLYFVLEYMEGGSLRTLLDREKQVPIETAISIARTIAEALDYAHRQGLVHRDVKPENILFTDGQAYLADFGIARAIERAIDESTTETGLVRGTPAYMSPEQASGSNKYDGRSDQYSLACVLYEMIAGVPAFIGATQEAVIAQRFQHQPRDLRVYRASVPLAVQTVIQKAMSLVVADRYESTADFAEALATALRSPQIEARSSDGAGRFIKPRPILWAAIGIAAIAAGAVFAKGTGHSPTPVEGIPEGDPRRVAVLYFDDLSPSTLPTPVADGITEDLIDRLGAVRALNVISPNGVRAFRRTAVPLDSVARVLKIGTIVSGSVARSGNTIRITVRLIDAATSRQLYSQPLEEQWTEWFALQDRLADQVAFFLRQRFGNIVALREHRAATKSFPAYEAVQLASDLQRRGLDAAIFRADTSSGLLLRQADSQYVRAAQLDPSWVLPIIRRGRLALAQALHSSVPPPRTDSASYARMTAVERRGVWARRGIELADQALRRTDSREEALSLRGEARVMLVADGSTDSDALAILAERDLRRALDIRPDQASAWSALAQLLRQQGRFADAADAAQRAFEADAYFELRPVMATAFMASLHAGRFEAARRWCRMGLDHYAGDPRFTECELTSLGWTARSTEAVARAQHLVQTIERRDTLRMLAPTWKYRRLMVAAIMARAGMRDSARAALSEIETYEKKDTSARGNFMTEAYVRLLLGQRDAAIDRLSTYLRASPQARAQVAKHPWFKELSGDARFQALVRPVQ